MTTGILLFVLLVAHTFAAVQWERIEERIGSCGNKVPKNCTASGNLCETCSSLVLCLQTDTDQFAKVPLSTCKSPEMCVKDKCSTDPDPFCDGTACLDFLCTGVGVFPDPFDCKKYVMCVKGPSNRLLAYPTECEASYKFNPKTEVCDLDLPDNVCPDDSFPVPLCLAAGQNAALDENTSIYFICKEYSLRNKNLYPFLYRCPHGSKYDNFKCA